MAVMESGGCLLTMHGPSLVICFCAATFVLFCH